MSVESGWNFSHEKIRDSVRTSKSAKDCEQKETAYKVGWFAPVAFRIKNDLNGEE